MPNVFTWPSTPPATVTRMITGDNSVVNLYDAPGIFFSPILESLDGWYQSIVLSSTITLIHSGVTMATGATANSPAILLKGPHLYRTSPTWADERKFKVELYCLHNANALSEVHLISGLPGIERHVGFKIVGGMAYGSVGDNSAETLTAESLDVWVATTGTSKSFEVIYTGSLAKFYINSVLLGTLSTGLPTGTTDATKAMYISVDNKATAVTMEIRISQIKHYLKPA